MTPIILFVGTTRYTNRQNPNGSVSASVPALELPICPLVMHATPEQIAKHGIGIYCTSTVSSFSKIGFVLRHYIAELGTYFIFIVDDFQNMGNKMF
jgi:hypothetical protein